MKITLQFNGKKVQNEVTEERGNEIFEKVASEILDLVKIKPRSGFTKECEKWKQFVGIAKYNDGHESFGTTLEAATPFEKMKQKATCEDKELEETEHKPIGRRLVIIKCTSCGKTITPVVFLDNTENVEITCPVCGEKHIVDKIYQARYKCYNCSKTASFFTDGSVETVTCIDCKTPLDLKFNEKKKEYYTL